MTQVKEAVLDSDFEIHVSPYLPDGWIKLTSSNRTYLWHPESGRLLLIPSLIPSVRVEIVE